MEYNKHITMWISNGSPLGENLILTRQTRYIRKCFHFDYIISPSSQDPPNKWHQTKPTNMEVDK